MCVCGGGNKKKKEQERRGTFVLLNCHTTTLYIYTHTHSVDINKSFKCIHECVFMCRCVLADVYVSQCISKTKSGSRVLRSHELGLIFCLITQWQARGCPVCLHAIGPLASAPSPQWHSVISVESRGGVWLTISELLNICPQRLLYRFLSNFIFTEDFANITTLP